MAFRGWPEAAFSFYAGLEANNTKAYWEANREVYDSAVKEPFDALSAEVTKAYGPLRLFRPYRDVRFSKDKSPYKTAAGAMTESEGGTTYYVQVSAEGLVLGSGIYHMAPDQLERYREAVADDRYGPEIANVCDRFLAAGYEIGAADALKTAPRGYPRDHPRIDLLRRKGLVVLQTFKPAQWMSSPRALDRIRQVWDDAEPLNDWLGHHVGPSSLPPDDLR
jgi:uncharacterized protein (TIGR02453 family)